MLMFITSDEHINPEILDNPNFMLLEQILKPEKYHYRSKTSRIMRILFMTIFGLLQSGSLKRD